jgi:hypothetical protein
MNELFQIFAPSSATSSAPSAPATPPSSPPPPRTQEGDAHNHHCDISLRPGGLALTRVPIATPHLGMVSAPRVGDLVLVTYIDGDVNRPVITGRLHSDEVPAPIHADDELWLSMPPAHTTRLGFTKAGAVLVQAGKTTLQLDPDGAVAITGETELKIQLKADATLKTDATLAIHCTDAKIHASGQHRSRRGRPRRHHHRQPQVLHHRQAPGRQRHRQGEGLIMPAPTAPQIASLARAAFRDADLSGAHADDLAGAAADTCARALAMFLAQAMVLPGIPAAIDPVSGSGSTSGPGKLLPPPAGGPVAAQLRGLALADLHAAGIQGEDAPPSPPSSPAPSPRARPPVRQRLDRPRHPRRRLRHRRPREAPVMPAPTAAQLAPIVRGLCQSEGLRGEHAPDLADAIAETVARALDLLLKQALVLPGIAVAPGSTVAPGRLQ